MTRTLRRTSAALLLLGLLAGCGTDGSAAEETGSPEARSTEAGSTGSATDLGLRAGDVLETGDCWGLDDEIQLDPIPCDGPHVYEVVGVVDDWPHEDYQGGFEAGVEGDEAMSKLCDRLTVDYFGYDPSDQGIVTDHGRPEYHGRPEVVVCSAHSGPGVEPFRTEIEGSFADRGHR